MCGRLPAGRPGAYQRPARAEHLLSASLAYAHVWGRLCTSTPQPTASTGTRAAERIHPNNCAIWVNRPDALTLSERAHQPRERLRAAGAPVEWHTLASSGGDGAEATPTGSAFSLPARQAQCAWQLYLTLCGRAFSAEPPPVQQRCTAGPSSWCTGALARQPPQRVKEASNCSLSSAAAPGGRPEGKAAAHRAIVTARACTTHADRVRRLHAELHVYRV
jgi:hypothetical protein